jgi:dCMP deaminase
MNTMDTLKQEWLRSRPDVQSAALSEQAKTLLYEMSLGHVEHERPSWDDTFMQLAYDIKMRSPDSQTQVGAIIVDESRHIVSVGYNGWMPGIDDSMIPNTREGGKHNWVLHGELNAILNCEHRPVNCTLYCTHKPCLPCYFAIVSAGITEVVYINGSVTTNTAERDAEWEVALFLTRDRIKVRSMYFVPRNEQATVGYGPQDVK